MLALIFYADYADGLALIFLLSLIFYADYADGGALMFVIADFFTLMTQMCYR